jgi:hypothetical protein
MLKEGFPVRRKQQSRRRRRLVGQFRQSPGHRSVALAKVIVVSRTKLHRAAGFNRQGVVAVELDWFASPAVPRVDDRASGKPGIFVTDGNCHPLAPKCSAPWPRLLSAG